MFFITDARTPGAHKTTHSTGGTDALAPSDIGAAADDHNHDGTYLAVPESASDGDVLTYDDDTSTWVAAAPAGGGGVGDGWFGDGSDGDVTIASDTTLSRDMYYNNLTVNAGVTLSTRSYRIFARNLNCDGTIENNGATAVLNVAGPGVNGSLAGGSSGGAGNAGGPAGSGSNGSVRNNSVSGAAGGAGGPAGLASGGLGGTVTLVLANAGGPNPLRNPIRLTTEATQIAGGSGGGGGANAGASVGGGGGAGGGTVLICAKTISGSGTLSARGGGGAPGTVSNAGGGGGGGGGFVAVITTAAMPLTINVAGGDGGDGIGSGGAGQPGAAGSSIVHNLGA